MVERAPPFQVSGEYPNLIPLQHPYNRIYPQMLPLHSECQSKPPLAQHLGIQLIIAAGFDANSLPLEQWVEITILHPEKTFFSS